MENKKIIVTVGAPLNGSGVTVDSVFGRTGNVVAENGDYNTDQVIEGTNKYFPEAPQDGKEYARKDAAWVEVQGGVISVNGEVGAVVLDGTDIELIEGGGISITQAISDLDTQVQGKVSSVQAGANVFVDDTDPQNPIVSSTPSTSAGLLTKTYFTGDIINVGGTDYYATNRDNQGVTATVVQQITVGVDGENFFAQDLLGDPYPVQTLIPKGDYSGVISVSATNSAIGTPKFLFDAEIYLTDANGTPVNSGVVGQPTGDLGVTVVAIATTGEFSVGLTVTEIQANLFASLPSELVIPSGYRIRYHIKGTKVGGFGTSDLDLYLGFDHAGFVEVPIPSLTSTVLNDDPTEFPSSATQYDINRSIKTNVDTNTTDIGILDTDKIESDDYASETVGGTLKARLDGNTLYLTNNGNNP